MTKMEFSTSPGESVTLKWIAAILPAVLLLTLPASALSIQKLSDVNRGAVGEIAIAAMNYGNSGLFVTAVSDSAGNLKILVWANDETTPRATTSEGEIRAVAAAPLPNKRFITAVRDSDDRLRIIAWRLSEDGRQITQLDTKLGPTIRELTAAAASSGVILAARRPDGTVMVTNAGLENGQLVVPETETLGEADRLAVAPGTTNMLVMRDADKRLRMIHMMTTGGFGTVRGGTSVAGEIGFADAGGFVTNLAGEWVTLSVDPGPAAVRTGLNCAHRLLLGHGRGKLIAWEKDTPSIPANFERGAERAFTGTGGIAKAVALEVLRDIPGNSFVTGHLGFDTFCKLLQRNRGKPRLELHLWKLGDAFDKRATARLGGDFTDLDIVQIARGPDEARFAVALKTASGNLKVTTWGVR